MSEPERLEVDREPVPEPKFYIATREKAVVDIDADVIPLETRIDNPIRVLAISKGSRERIFAPPVQPQMQGRRPSGVIFNPGEVPKEARGEPVYDPPPDLKVTKRVAKSVCEEMTGCGVQCREQGGRCYIEIIMPRERLEFVGTEWLEAVASVKVHFDEMRKGKFRVL